MSTYDEDLTNLDEWLRRLNIEYHIFFSGNQRQPPDDLRLRVERTIKKLSDCSGRSYSQRFRYNTLMARFYLYKDRWRRELRDREMGIERKGEASSLKSDTPSYPSVRARETVCISISDPKAEEEKVRALYETLMRIRATNAQEEPPSYQQFASYIAKQTYSIREKYGCSKVAFTVALDEDAIRFTAAAEKL
jgi:hypothetical protein